MKYISILRGINVSGQKKIKMADLKTLYESLGLEGVTTYIQSGNVIFDSASTDKTGLISKLERAISSQYGFHVPVDIRTRDEFKKIIKSCPFEEAHKEENGTKVLVTFLNTAPDSKKHNALLEYVKPPERLVISEKEVYLYCPNGYGKSKLSNSFLESKLGVQATTRNWKSVNALYGLSCL